MTPEEILAHLAATGTAPSDIDVAAELSVGLESALGRLDHEVFPVLRAGGGDLQFIFGPYGRGKSHYLRAVQALARSKGFVTSYVDCLSQQHPFRSLQESYSLVARNIAVPGVGVRADDQCGLSGLVRHAFQRRAEEVAAVRTRLRVSHGLVPDFRNLVTAYGSLAVEGKTHEGVGPGLSALLDASGATAVTVSQLYRELPTLPKPLGKLSRRTAANWLRSLLSLPRALGYPGFVVLFDETEPLVAWPSRRARSEQLANLRNLVDYMALGALTGCAIYYAAAEDFLSVAKERLDALAQRIETVELEQPQSPRRNVRAIWTNLDHLSDPDSSVPEFYDQLGRKIIDWGVQAGLTDVARGRLSAVLRSEVTKGVNSINQGAVRVFVKTMASYVSVEASRGAM